MSLHLTFHGGAETVTGSRFELEVDGRHYLVDCGLFQGLKALRLLNWRAPEFDVRRIEAVFITHAHIDHTGYLPRLVKEGFRGPIYCTPATRELAEIMLMDAARIQEEDARYANRKGFSKHHPALPLFDERDARAALAHMQPVPFGKQLDVGPLRVRFHQAGHILGSAFIELDVRSSEASTSLVFSGDLGRTDQPLHPDPERLPNTDTLVLESTYGDRAHDRETFARQMASAFRKTIERRGTILIPAFAVARAQLVTLLLRDLIESGQIPAVPIHIDSPMAVDVTDIYQRHAGTSLLDALPGGQQKLFPKGVQFHRTVDESKALSALPGPRIIISASGMMTGGRVLHHLKRLLPDPLNLLLLAGFQAAGTRGRAVLEGAATVRIHGQDIPVRAQVLEAQGLSAHADRGELEKWVQSAEKPPTNLILVHGEPEALKELAREFRSKGFHPIVPRLGERFAFEPRSGRWKSAGSARSEDG